MRTIKLLSLVILAAGVAFTVWLYSFGDVGPLDRHAADRIRQLCGARTDCQVEMRDLVQGDWDHLFEFGGSADQADVTGTLHDPNIKIRHQRRLVVLMRAGKVIRADHTNVGQQTPLKGEVAFDPGDLEKAPATAGSCRKNS